MDQNHKTFFLVFFFFTHFSYGSNICMEYGPNLFLCIRSSARLFLCFQLMHKKYFVSKAFVFHQDKEVHKLCSTQNLKGRCQSLIRIPLRSKNLIKKRSLAMCCVENISPISTPNQCYSRTTKCNLTYINQNSSDFMQHSMKLFSQFWQLFLFANDCR